MEGRKKGQQILSRMGVRAVVIDLVFHLFSRWDFWFPPSRTSPPSLLPYQGSEKNSFICSHEAPLYLQLLLLLLQFGDLERGRKAYYWRSWQNRHGRCSALLLPAVACYYAVLGAPYYFTSFLSCILSFHHHVFAKRPWRREGLCFPSWNTLEGSSKTSLGSFLQQYLPVRASGCSSSILLFPSATLWHGDQGEEPLRLDRQTYIHTYIILSKDSPRSPRFSTFTYTRTFINCTRMRRLFTFCRHLHSY